MRYLGLLLVAGLAAGCTSPSISMLNPASGARANCGSHLDLWIVTAEFLASEEMDCQRDLEVQGWVRAPLQF
jgi:hypothetical protein